MSGTKFYFNFLSSPSSIIGDQDGNVIGLEVEDTKLVPFNGDTKARGLGTKRVLDVDTIVFCIGDRVDESFGLPVEWNEFVKNPNPLFPVDDISYEVYDPDSQKPVEGVFIAGWSREASSGLVGVARKDGQNGAKALTQYLSTLEPASNPNLIVQEMEDFLKSKGIIVISKEDIKRLEAIERKEAERLGTEEFKMKTNEEMLKALAITV